MVDVFVSYARADREWVAPLAESLAARGWSVWWDRQIPPGKTFDQVIEEALDQAKAVIVVWSRSGVASHWVRTEAAEGAARQILVPVLRESVTLPLAFRRIQAADLTDWNPGEDHPGYTELLGALTELIGDGSVTESVPETEDALGQALSAARARTATEDWEAVIALLSPFEEDSDAREDPEVKELLTSARVKLEAGELYEEAELLFAEGRWTEVIARLDRVAEIDPATMSTSTLKERAERHIADERRMRIGHLHERASEAIRSREWAVALALLDELLALDPGHEGARALVARARAGARVDKEYQRLRDLFVQQRWEEVVEGVVELREADPEFGDPDRLKARAMEELETHQLEPENVTTPKNQATGTDAFEPAVPGPEHHRNVPSLGLLEERLPPWWLGVLGIASAHLPWLNPSGREWIPGLFLPVNWAGDADSSIHLGFPVIILGAIVALTASDERSRRVRRVAGAGLVVVVVAHVLAALWFGEWAPGETAASAGPYLALIVGLVAASRRSPSRRPHQDPTFSERARPRRVVVALTAVGGLFLLIGLSLPEFVYYVSAFDLNGFASVGIGDFFEDSSWLLSLGTLLIVALATCLLVAFLRYREALRGTRMGAALSLLLLAGPWAPVISNPDRDLSEFQAGYLWAVLGTATLLLAAAAAARTAARWLERASFG